MVLRTYLATKDSNEDYSAIETKKKEITVLIIFMQQLARSLIWEEVTSFGVFFCLTVKYHLQCWEQTGTLLSFFTCTVTQALQLFVSSK